MRRFFQTFTLCFSAVALSTTPLHANASLQKDRKQFLKAEKLLKQKKTSAYKKVRKQLDAYPLAPYLDYQQLLMPNYKLTSAEVSDFMDMYVDLPLANRLNRTWLNRLYKQKRWGDYVSHFDTAPIDQIRYQCQYQYSQYQLGGEKRKLALKAAKNLWMVGKSQPKHCDPLFKAWMQTGHPTSAEANQRFWLSVEQQDYKLARYLETKVKNKALKKNISLFWALHKKPAQVATATFKQLTPEQQQIAYAPLYKRWARQQPVTAAKTWVKQRDKLLSEEKRLSVTEYMGLRLNRNYHSQAITLSQKLDPDFQLEDLTEARIRNALAKQKWKVVKTTIAGLPEETQKDPKWQYWRLVADRHINPKDDHRKELKVLAQDRSYYGFLAAELIQTPFKLNAKSDAFAPEALAALAAKPGPARAGELFKLGRLTEANREWRMALARMNDQEKLLAGYLAKSWDWHLQAIINAAKTKRWDHIDLRFPHPHRKLFEEHARKNKLDLSFPVAIARQESAFLFNATSRVGARGLMQLMPKTAKATAKKHRVPYKSKTELFKPELNITLGSAYLGDMLKKFDNNPAHAAAAYNAGPHRVTKWLKQRGKLPLDVWIETIPFRETRKYVQNVLAFRVVYDRLEGRQASLLTEKQVQLLALNKSQKTAL